MAANSEPLGFRGVTPIPVPTAYTQTYATATRTHSNITASTVVTTAAGLAIYGFTEAQANAVVAAVNALRVDVLNVKQVLNSLLDDLQNLGIID
mgnify:CR=1 FL=1